MFDNIRVLRSKIVKTRKEHNCIECNRKIKIKELCRNTVFIYDNIVSAYFCLDLKCNKNEYTRKN